MTEKVEVKMEDGLVVVQESQVPVIYASKENIQIVIDMIRREVTGHDVR